MNNGIELDRFDRSILAIIQENNLTPHRVIGERVGLSAPAVTRRLGRLRESGVIRRDVSLVDGTAVGRSLTLIVQVVADSEQTDQLDAMRNAFKAYPQVQHCYYVTGEADFILIFNVSDMHEYEQLTRSLFIENPNVKRFTTFVAMETVKAGQEVFVQG